jgi:hypothetical protein
VAVLEASVADVARRDLERRGQPRDRVERREPALLDPEVGVGTLARGRVRRELLDDEPLR